MCIRDSYVTGDINISGRSQLINSGLLVAEGKVKQAGQSSYQISGDRSQIGLVSFDANSQAIQLSGQGSSIPMGLVYAANGGIKVSGQGDVFGGLVAAGKNGLGAVQISGQGDLFYPYDLLAESDVVPGSFSVVSWLER